MAPIPSILSSTISLSARRGEVDSGSYERYISYKERYISYIYIVTGVTGAAVEWTVRVDNFLFRR